MYEPTYMQFELTAADLEKCIKALDRGDELSTEEQAYADKLKELAQRYIEVHQEVNG